MLDSAAQFFFRRRNAIFPVLFAALVLAFPPGAPGDLLGEGLVAAGLLLVALGEALRVATIGLDYIKRGGKRGRFFAENLVTSGVFAHCRNPLYLGNQAVVLGFLLVWGNPAAIAIGGSLFVLIYAVLTRGEERYLAGRFGAGYLAYCAEVPRWFPHPGRLWTTLRSHRLDWRMVVRKEYGTLYVAFIVPLGLLAWRRLHAGGWEALAPALPLFASAAGIGTAAYVLARYLTKTHRLEPRPAAPAGGLMGLRARVDEIDAGLLRLLNERAAQVAEIFAIKEARGVVRYDRKRSQEIIGRLLRLNRGPLNSEQVERLFSVLLDFFAFEYEPAGRPPARADATVEVVVPAEVAMKER